jgi:hypothetical protein
MQTQQVTFKRESVMQSRYVTDLKVKNNSSGYHNGLSSVVRRIKCKARNALGVHQGFCPDGERHPSSVCLRGWRGDVCSRCPSSGI